MLIEISFVLAFLGGMLSLLSPCTISIIPAFVAITANSKGRLFRSTLSFFLGFTMVFVLLGLIASLVGSSIVSIFGNTFYEEARSNLVVIAGFFLVLMGIFSILGKGFSGIKIKNKFKNSKKGLFLFGIAFGLGWSPCVGPILGGILSVAASLPLLNAGLLLFFYSFGMWFLLFFAGVLHDKYGFGKKLLSPKQFTLNFFGRKKEVEVYSFFSGIILIFFGLIFIVFKSELFLSSINLFNSLNTFLLLQGVLTQYNDLFNKLDLLFVALFLLAVYLVFRKERKLL